VTEREHGCLHLYVKDYFSGKQKTFVSYISTSTNGNQLIMTAPSHENGGRNFSNNQSRNIVEEEQK